MKDSLSIEKDKFIKQFAESDSKVLKSIRMMKEWRHKNIGNLDPKNGFPNNYAFTMIILYVMKRLKVIKYPDNEQQQINQQITIDEIFHGFLISLIDCKYIFDLRITHDK